MYLLQLQTPSSSTISLRHILDQVLLNYSLTWGSNSYYTVPRSKEFSLFHKHKKPVGRKYYFLKGLICISITIGKEAEHSCLFRPFLNLFERQRRQRSEPNHSSNIPSNQCWNRQCTDWCKWQTTPIPGLLVYTRVKSRVTQDKVS